jgi:hypothetical protein
MITRDDLADYLIMKKAIEVTKRKITNYQTLGVHAQHGKVNGSMATFPYIQKGFTVSGYDAPINKNISHEKIMHLKTVLSNQLRELEEKTVEIELFISNISDLTTKLIFTYTYIDGMRQEDVANELNLERSSISKRISRYFDSLSENVTLFTKHT